MTVMRPNYNYWTYQCLDLVFPFIISALTFIYLVNSFLIFCCKPYSDQQGSKFEQVGFFSDIIYPYTKVAFRSSLKKESKDGGSTYRFKLHRHVIHKYDMLLLSSLTSWIISLAFFAFWDSFLIRQTYGCDSRLDCFNLTNSILNIKPIDNCTHMNTNDIAICYEFVFDVVGGFSSAVGVLGISVFYFNANLSILNCLKRRYDDCYFRIGRILTSLLPFIIIGLGVTVVFIFLDFFEKSDLFHYRVLIYCFWFVTLAIIPSCAGHNRIRKKNYQRRVVDLRVNGTNRVGTMNS